MQRPPRPLPGLAPAPITMEQYEAFSPEKVELWQGYLFGPPDHHETRRNCLVLLLANEGLEAVVRLAPAELWQEALRSVYGES